MARQSFLAWTALVPGALLGLVSLAVGVALSGTLDVGPAVVLPHLAVVLSLAAVLYAWVLIGSALKFPLTLTRIVASFGAVLVGVALTVFYFALFASLFLFKELPTRQLIAGYTNDLPALLRALPATDGTIAMFVGLVGTAGVLFGALIAWTLDWGRGAITSWSRRPVGSVVSRVVIYGGFTHLLFAAFVPLDWHAQNREPVFSSWHDVRLNNPVIFGQKNPVQTALDAKAEAAYPRLATKRTPNVILVYVDALRADVTQPYGAERTNMPFITSLVRAGELRQADLAVAACPSTICGLGALLQSKPTWLQSPDNFSLPKVLARQGYRNAYVLASNHQSFFDLKDYYRPFDFYLDGKDMSATRHGDDYLVLEGLDRLGPWDGRPTFLMLGLISPHVGGIRAQANRRYLPDRFSFTGGKEKFREAYRNNYDNGIVQVDDVLAKVWRKLDDNGFLKDAIVVITADHGESLGEHGTFGHLTSLAHAELNIPLWIRDPRLPPGRIGFARQIDIAPTILDSLGLPLPATWYGQSLYRVSAVQWSDHYVPDFRDRIAVIRHDSEETLKYYYDRSTGAESAFELGRDPLERDDILREVPAWRLDEMRQRAKTALLGH
jgi:glucan phosphoethanolaminetransferase (alkaline phosphatase superfamily)